MEPTGSGQIERESVCPVLFEDFNKSCPTWDLHSDMLYSGGYIPGIKKQGGGGGWKNTRNFFLLEIFLKTISTRESRYIKKACDLGYLTYLTLGNDQDTSESFQFIHTPFTPNPAQTRRHTRERAMRCDAVKAITTSCRTFSYLPA